MKKHVMILFVILLLAACSNNQEAGEQQTEEPDQQEETDEQNGESEPPEENEEPTHEGVYPLTGEQAKGNADNRVLAVMVNNLSKARPQTGLTKADIVYEALAEGTITRFLAMYHSNSPEEIGPVRSARPYFFQLAAGMDALYTYHGASHAINQQLVNSGVEFLNGSTYDNDGKLFKRVPYREAPHDSYVLPGGVSDVAEAKGYALENEIEPLPFASEGETKLQNGQSVSNVEIVYAQSPQNIVSYHYDETSGKFARSSDGQPTAEYHTDEQVAVENVFIVETGHQIVDDAGRREIDLTSGGEGYLLQKGKLYEVNWQNTDGRILPYQDGEPVSFVPGQTWVNIVPENPGIEQSISVN